MQVAQDTVVSLHYELLNSAGELIEKTDDPIEYLHGGYAGIFELVEDALQGKAAGETCEVYLQPVDAFGEYDEKLVQIVPLSKFPSTLEVSIEEHRPFAKWKDGDGERSRLVNNFGEVFEAEFDGPLPVLSGPDGTAKEVLEQFDRFKSVLAGIDRTPMAVSLSARRAWQLRLENGASLELGRAEAVERLNRYVAAYAVVPALQAANARIDMRYQSGMALKVADADLVRLAPATARKTIKKPTAKL